MKYSWLIMERIFNFSAGPSMLPVEVLETAQRELVNFSNTGMSIMEMSHRSKPFETVHNKALSDLRDLLNIPSNYKILLMQGGGSLQFACIPLNLLREKTSASYLVTGAWSEKAAQEASKYCDVQIVASGKPTNFTSVPEASTWTVNQESAYFHYCANETIHGLEFDLTEEMLEKIGNVPIVADMSSNFLSKPVDISKHAVVYAGAQKNAGPAGVTIVIVREDLLGHSLKITPTMCDWKTQADNNSLYNTPPCFSIYMCGLYFDYMKRHGGLEAFHTQAIQKAGLVYDVISASNGFYSNPVDPRYRSKMNIPFLIKGGESLEKKFLAEAEKVKLSTLAGHRSVGGLRASVYNGMPMEGAAALAQFMKDFETANS
jgi:phosphoserine aminotransferase